jgi:Isochorismate hydrolase
MPASIPADYFDLVPALAPEAGDLVVTKRQWGAFYGTDLELQLRRRGLKTLILTGIATNFGVESTARFAFELGFEQIFVSDAISAASEAAHDASLAVFARMGHVRPADVVVQSIETART